MADTITLRTSTDRDVIKIVERGPQGPAGGGGGGGSGTVTSVALAGTGLSITGSPVTTSGTITANVTYGTTAGTACQGNDSRLSNARTPTAHAASHASSGSDPLTLEDLTNVAVQNGSITTWNDGTANGSINTSWGGNLESYGGSIDTHGDDEFGAGGSINTSAGGGSINTRGTGSIEFGIAGTRTTLTGTATANRAISLPDAAGTLALTSDITKTAVGLGNVTNNAQVTSVSGTAPIVSSGGTTPAISISAASTSAAGSMSAADKTKLDGIAASANNYTHPNHTGDVTSVGDGATTIAANAVTNAKLAQIATSTIKGRATSGTGNVEDLSSAQVLTILGLLGAIKDMKVVSPSSDVTATSSTTLSNVSGMSFSVAANTTYLIFTNLQMSVGAGGYSCEISFPSILNNGTTAGGFGVQLPGSNSLAGLSTTSATTVKVSNRGAVQTTPSFSILLVRTDSTGGTANFQWAQSTSSAVASTLSSNTRALVVPLTT